MNGTCTNCEFSWTASTTGKRYCSIKIEDGGGTSTCTPEEINEGCWRWKEEEK